MIRESAVTIKAWQDRLRGLIGHVSAVFTVTETSANGALHTHSIGYTPFSLKVMVSIISNELSSVRVFKNTPLPEFRDPTKMWDSIDIHDPARLPTSQTTLPIPKPLLPYAAQPTSLAASGSSEALNNVTDNTATFNLTDLGDSTAKVLIASSHIGLEELPLVTKKLPSKSQ